MKYGKSVVKIVDGNTSPVFKKCFFFDLNFFKKMIRNKKMEQQKRGPKITTDNYVETPEMIQEAEVLAREQIKVTNIPEINLSQEELVSYGINPETDSQEPLTHAVVSFLTPAFGHTCTGGTLGLKIYSAHTTEKDAVEFAGRLKEYHTELYGKPIYSILVMEMGKLVTIPTNRDELNRLWKDKQAADEHLNQMISDYRIQQQKSQILFDKRKETLMNSAKEFSALERARQLRLENGNENGNVDTDENGDKTSN